MNQDQLNQARQELTTACEEVLKSKGVDYAGQNGDRLSNFKLIDKLLQNYNVNLSTPLGVWAVFYLKHVCSVLAYIGHHTESEPILGRFVDLRNYTDLGYCLIVENNATQS